MDQRLSDLPDPHDADLAHDRLGNMLLPTGDTISVRVTDLRLLLTGYQELRLAEALEDMHAQEGPDAAAVQAQFREVLEHYGVL